uniref:Mitochondrial inner membrane protein Mpv17 n=2 Tax=Meloidogyne incognita group TaxID=654580 RepID=A0A915NFW2_MELJA
MINPARIRQYLPSKAFCVQVVSAGTLAGVGNVICQKYVEKREHIDRRRVSQFALTTMIIVVPIQFHWFRFLDRRITGRGRLQTAVKRVIVDQSCLAPLLTGAFLFSVNFMDSHSTNNALQRTKRIYLDVMSNNYKFWPFLQAVNMTMIPLHFRVIFLQFFAIFWNIYVSYKANVL